MARVVDLNADRDIDLDPFGNADFLVGVEAEKQILRNALVIFFGTWFDDPSSGVDWLRILGKQFNINQIKSEIRRVLLRQTFVVKILNVSLGEVEPDRTVEITFVVTTISGNTITFSEGI